MNGTPPAPSQDGPPAPTLRVRAVRLLAALTAPPWRTRWAFVAALAAGAAYLDLFRLQLEWMGDDGVFTVGARRLARGEAAYRDFSTHTTPGAFYLIAAVGSILGHSFETARLVGMILALAVAGAVYVFTHRLTASVPVALLGFALALLPFAYAPSYSHHSLSAVLALASAGCWWRWQATRSGILAATAGLFDGLAGFTSHNKGAFLLAASLLIVLLFAGPGWSSRLRALAAYAAGGAAVGLIFVCILLAQGALGAFLEDCVFFVLRNYSDIQSVPYGTLFGMFDHRSGPGIVAVEVLLTWPAAAPLVAAALELALVLRDRRGRRLTALLAVHGTVHLGAALHRPDFVHLHIVAMVPTALLLAHLHLLRGQPAAASDARRSLSACSAAALLGLAAVCVGGAWTIVADALRAPRHPVPSVGSGAWTSSPPLAETVEGVARLVKTRTAAGEPIFVFPHSSVYYLAADRPNATRFDVPLESPGREPMIDEIVRTLDREKVRYVVLDTWWTEAMVESLFPNLGISFMNGRFTAYLDRAYDVELRLPLAVVYRRKPG